MPQPSEHTASPELMRYLAELRGRVNRYRRYGLLPQCPESTSLHACRGSGLACAICGEPVLAAEAEIILMCSARGRFEGTGTILRLHHLCHVIWLGECSRP